MFPETTILMVHMGGAGFGPALYDAGLRTAKECPNVYMVASECAGAAIENAIRALGANRVMYASDTPFVAMKYGWAQIQAVLEDFSEEDKKAVMGGTAEKVFGF
jgi:predicted TIM-barrel fold metal-dependent hydrolase